LNLLQVLIGDSAPGASGQSPFAKSKEESSMKTRTWMWTTVVYLFAALAMPAGMASQDNPSPDHKSRHHQYKLIDLGTFGGTNSYMPNLVVSINSQGAVMVEADTSIPDPYNPNCWQNDCLVNHTGIWQDGVLTDLGALPGVNSAGPTWINDRGVVVGGSQNGVIDPLNGVPAVRAVVWKHGQIIDLGTFGGYESSAQAINNRGQVTGIALNTILDPFESSLALRICFVAE
jgi:uncharacterized membrane protein